MSGSRALAVAALAAVSVAGCGLYGEKGFSGNNPLSAPRFIEEVDETCADVNADLDDDFAVLLGGDPAPDDETEDAIGELRDAIDELAEELPEHNGPTELEAARDDYVQVLEDVDDVLKDARDAIRDGDDDAFEEHLGTALAAVEDAEEALRSAGFDVCGMPRPAT